MISSLFPTTETLCATLKNAPNAFHRITAGALAVTGALLLSSCAGEPLPAGQAEYAAGIEAMYLGDNEKADELFAQAETVDPANPWRLLGEAARYQLTSAPLGALRSCEAMLAIAPDFDSAYTVYCRVALDENKRYLAETMAETYNSHFNLSDPETPNPEQRRNYLLITARIALQSGEFTRAIETLAEAANERESDTRLRLVYAEAHYRKGNTAEARKLGDDAFADSREREDDIRTMIDFCALSSQAVRSAEMIEELLEDNENNLEVLRFASERYMRLGYLDWADQKIYELEQLDNTVTLTRYLKGVLAESAGEYNRARLQYEYALSQDLEETSNIELFRDFARAHRMLGNFAPAGENYEMLLMYASRNKRSPEYIADLNLEYAELYFTTKQWLDGLKRSEKARPDYNGSPRLEILRAISLNALLLPDSARALMTKSAAEAPNNLEWSQALARGWAQLNELDSVRHYLDRALQIEPAGFGSLMASAQLQIRLSDSAGYEATLAKLVEHYGDDRRVMRIQASLYASRGEDIRLLEIANRMIELYPGDLSTYQLAARSAQRKYGGQQAQEYLRQAITNNPDLPAAYNMLAVNFLTLANTDSAMVYIDKAFELRPLYQAAELARGVIFEAKGRIDSATAVYTGIIERDPFSVDAHNNLAWLLASNDLELDRAANLARQAISLSAGINANTYGTYGWALYKLGKHDQANTAYQRAVQLAPNDPVKRYLMGVNYEKWEKPDLAREQLESAVDLGISGDYLTLTRQALGRLDG